jgi:regulator of protease activity HflC (stomatin/prohibitin superfamily)
MKKLILIVAVAMSLSSCREKIDAGNIGLLINQYGEGKGQGVQISAGVQWYNPWSEDVIEIPAFVQHKEFETFSVNASDGSEFSLSPQLNYRIDKDHVAETYRKYRKGLPELENGVIKTILKETYRIILNGYTTDSIMKSRRDIENKALKELKLKLESEGFVVEQLTSGLYPPKSISESIDAKNKAVQDAMRIDNEVKTTEANARKQVAEAKGNAEALLTNARAEAEASRLRQQYLTPLLVQRQFIEKWDGALPVYGQTPQLFKDITK